MFRDLKWLSPCSRLVRAAGLTLLASVFLSACMERSGSDNGRFMAIQPISFNQISGWERENHVALLPLVRLQCRRLAQLPPETRLGGAYTLPSGHKVADWAGVCAALPDNPQPQETEARQYFEQWFVPYNVTKNAFYTGYYEPEIEGALERFGAYQTPLYRRPPDLLRQKTPQGSVMFGRDAGGILVPYDDRAAIDGGSLSGRNLEMAWLKNPVDLLFLQLQGSGRLHLPDGQIVRIAYDGQNGQPYVPIGRKLVQRGVLRAEDVNDVTIRDWLESHPGEIAATLEENPNYVFFRFVDHSRVEGPTGAFGVALSPGRSIAIDRHMIPFGSPVWVETPMPLYPPAENGSVVQGQWNHLTLAQDTGTDIQGAGRGDLFTGWGEKAHFIAGHLRGHGRMIVMVPRRAFTADANIAVVQQQAVQQQAVQQQAVQPQSVADIWRARQVAEEPTK